MRINVVASGTFFSKLFIFFFSVLNFAFLTTSLATKSLTFFKCTGTAFNLPTSRLSYFVFVLFKPVGTLISF